MTSVPSAARKCELFSDEHLVGLAAAGDRTAYGELIRRHAKFVRSLLRRMGADAALADDLTQDTFINALHSLPGYRLEAPFTAWIRTVAARLFLKHKGKHARTILMAEPATASFDTQGLEAGRMDLDAALRLLSPAQRTCVTLCHGAGLTQQEIAAQLGVPVGTVKSHTTRGLDKLRRHLTPSASTSERAAHG